MKTIATALVAFAILCLNIPASDAQTATWTPPGPAVGSTFPDALALPDHTGKQQSLKGLLGKNGAALVFVRSADWCPFCKKQLADLNSRLAEFKALGLTVISVSHDEVDKIAGFHTSQSIGYPMLADPNGVVVEKLGIRDMQYADGSKAYGVARPIIFIVDSTLRITHKYAEESYRNRPDLNKVLAELHNGKAGL